MAATITTRISKAVERVWKSEETKTNPFLSAILFLLSLAYTVAVRLRNFCYDSRIFPAVRLSCPVISVGNITVGGTGKTPFVIMLARYFKGQGLSPAVLSRGYGGKRKAPVVLAGSENKGASDYQNVGEEALLLARALPGIPVIVGPKRIQTGQVALDTYKANIIILDDGFQHRQIFRDLDIILLDEVRPFGNGRVFPRGPLREESDSLKRAQVIVYTGGETDTLESEPGRLSHHSTTAPGSAVFRARRRPVRLIRWHDKMALPLGFLKGKRVSLFAALGTPENFRKTVESLGAEVVIFCPYPDHHHYQESDFRKIISLSAEARSDLIITTEKDAVKLGAHVHIMPEALVLQIEMALIPDAEGFMACLLSHLYLYFKT